MNSRDDDDDDDDDDDVGLSVNLILCFQTEISLKQISMTFCADVHGPQKMNPDDFLFCTSLVPDF